MYHNIYIYIPHSGLVSGALAPRDANRRSPLQPAGTNVFFYLHTSKFIYIMFVSGHIYTCIAQPGLVSGALALGESHRRASLQSSGTVHCIRILIYICIVYVIDHVCIYIAQPGLVAGPLASRDAHRRASLQSTGTLHCMHIYRYIWSSSLYI